MCVCMSVCELCVHVGLCMHVLYVMHGCINVNVFICSGIDSGICTYVCGHVMHCVLCVHFV